MSKNDSLKANDLKNVTGGADEEENKYVPNFVSGVDVNSCICCGECASSCPMECIKLNEMSAVIDLSLCAHCGACASVCPSDAIDLSVV